ncbi:glycogen debranching protein [Dactylosporangium vinaceum]|uniref:Amylo-alpha-1,6-glucosidase n=1 Tax=Dactylosporangium vinaceum TaxID=53362 RepID=A0ABV5MDZ2_9ACTN|nr:glycogen debranching protein [Dactylosporangium vinaceum]UAC01001.1 glycogen debranching protein [Dactylosporangium vinaceum]
MFAIRDTPFSHPGSWFGISPVIAQGHVADDLHLVSHQSGMHAVLRFVPAAAGTAVTATPARLEWVHGSGRIELTYETPDTVRLRGAGLGLTVCAAASTLTPFSGTYLYRDPVDGAHVFTNYETGRRYRLTVLTGAEPGVRGAEALGPAERGVVLGAGHWEIAIEEYAGERPPYRPALGFDAAVKAAHERFTAFADAVAPWRDASTPAAELAAYVLWSATVAPAGFVTRPAVLMSKHWMDKVWSWDHCFNALALAAGDPALAWDQIRLVFDHQDDSGALPDSITHSEVLYNFVKPPIHGWALARLGGPRDPRTYEQLARWTEFWLTARRAPGEELPHYQHGNDSGWDNATLFDAGRVVQAPDLAAFLILQLRELGWHERADRLRAALLERLWDGERFVARAPGSGGAWSTPSLLFCMPIVLGDELPPEVRDALAGQIRAHLTEHGLATERPDSGHYEADGYWRGPIWAPSTVLIEDGLRRAGHTGLADEISARFRALCERSGFAENFDAHTGAGLRDRAYTWTASAYLILAAAHAQRRRP